MRQAEEREILGNTLFFHLPKLQINREDQKPDKAYAHNETDLTVFKFLAGFIYERVGALNGFFTRRGDLLKSISAERMHICARLL